MQAADLFVVWTLNRPGNSGGSTVRFYAAELGSPKRR